MATWATWAVPYKQLSIDQQRAAWFMDGNSKVKGQHPVWKAATLIEEGKNKSARQAELHDVWPYVWVFTNSWDLSNGLARWSGRRTMELGHGPGNARGFIKVEHVNAHQKNPLPELEIDWNW